MENLSILLIEDDSAACKAFVDIADTLNDISLVNVTNNAVQAIEDIKNFLPNVIILDLELHKGRGSGFDVLKALQDMPLYPFPYILITTNNSSAVTYDYARQLGADYIFYKHQDDYSAEGVLNLILSMKSLILKKNAPNSQNQPEKFTPAQQQKKLTRRICSELNKIGINPKVIGYLYLTEGIQLSIQGQKQRIFDKIAEMHGKSVPSVERAMQTAIKRAWLQSDIDDLLNLYTARIHSDKGVPTATEFICYYANKLENEY